MLAVSARLPDQQSGLSRIVLVHGAANSSVVWTYWQAMLADAGYASYAIDLRGHGASTPVDLSSTTMADYANDVRRLLDERSIDDGQGTVIIGWSMGGLVALLAAAQPHSRVSAVVGLAPSTPALRSDVSLPLRSGQFDAAEYGITNRDPDHQPAMPDLDHDERTVALSSLGNESRLARNERARGVVLRDLPCPLLIVTGTADAQWPRGRYDHLHLMADYLSADGASHWGLVLNRPVLHTLVPQVVKWIEGVTNVTRA
jgi:pimeloyl-ACP methyl ester carboxylesterase